MRAERLLLGSLLALGLSACGGGSEPPPQAGAQPGAAPVAAAAPPKPVAEKPQPTGLTDLPTPNDVIAAVKSGREDPFATLTPSGAGPGGRVAVARLTLPDAFRFSGVIRSAGVSQAIVEYGGTSGALSVGDRGGSSTDLLPSGWSVAGINVDRGVLTLRQGKQTVSAEL